MLGERYEGLGSRDERSDRGEMRCERAGVGVSDEGRGMRDGVMEEGRG